MGDDKPPDYIIDDNYWLDDWLEKFVNKRKQEDKLSQTNPGLASKRKQHKNVITFD